MRLFLVVCLVIGLGGPVLGQRYISSIVYWFDFNPLTKQTYLFPELKFNQRFEQNIVLPNNLKNGLHFIHFQTCDEKGVCSSVLTKPFYKWDTDRQIISWQYWANPATTIPASSQRGRVVTASVDALLNNLSPGFHWIYARAVDNFGVWSVPVAQIVYRPDPKQQAKIQYIRYRLNNGSWINDTINPAQTTVVLKDSLKLDTLPNGNHWLYLQVQDSVKWGSVVLAHRFYKGPGPKAKFDVEPRASCPGKPITFYSRSEHADSLVWSYGDGQTGKNNDTVRHLYQTPGTYKPKLTVYNTVSKQSATYTDQEGVKMDTVPRARLTRGDTAYIFCDSAVIEAVSQRGYAFRWLKDGIPTGQRLNRITVADPKAYRAVVIGPNGCTDTTPPIRTVINTETLSVIIVEGNLLRVNPLIANRVRGFQWKIDGTPIPGATAQTLRTRQVGSYSVELLGFGTCKTESESVRIIPNNLNLAAIDEITIYPNPFGEQINLTFPATIIPLIIQLIDANGQVVYQNTVSNTYQIDTRHLPSGLYTLIIFNGSVPRVHKLIKP